MYFLLRFDWEGRNAVPLVPVKRVRMAAERTSPLVPTAIGMHPREERGGVGSERGSVRDEDKRARSSVLPSRQAHTTGGGEGLIGTCRYLLRVGQSPVEGCLCIKQRGIAHCTRVHASKAWTRQSTKPNQTKPGVLQEYGAAILQPRLNRLARQDIPPITLARARASA